MLNEQRGEEEKICRASVLSSPSRCLESLLKLLIKLHRRRAVFGVRWKLLKIHSESADGKGIFQALSIKYSSSKHKEQVEREKITGDIPTKM